MLISILKNCNCKTEIDKNLLRLVSHLHWPRKYFFETRGLQITTDQTGIIPFSLRALYEFNNKNKTNKNVLLDEKEKSEGVAISTKRNESRIEPREAAYISFRIILFETAQQGPANSSIILSPTVRFHQSSVVELVEDILYIRPSRLNIHKTAPLYTHNRVRNVVCHDSR